jgi:O-antigen ligase
VHALPTLKDSTVPGTSISRNTLSGLIVVMAAAAALSGLLISVLVSHFPTDTAAVLIAAIPLALIILVLAISQATRNLAFLRSNLNRWHILWWLSYVSALVFRIRETSASRVEPLDLWSAFRIGPEAIILFVLAVSLVTRQLDWVNSLCHGLFGFLALYCLWCGISTVWSVYPLWTFYKAGEYLLDVSLVAAIVISLHSVEDYKVFFDWTWTLFGVELLWVWTQALLWPHEALEDSRLRGIFPATAYNAVGESGAVLAIVAFCRLIPLVPRRFSQPWYSCLFLFGVTSMLVSQTRSAIAGLVFACALALFFSKGKLGTLFILAGAAGTTFTGLGVMVWTFLQRDQNQGAFSSLTGRVDWWIYAWQQFLQHPLTGLGAYAGGKFAVMGTLGFNASSTHSDYIELLVGAGIPGLVMFLIPLIAAWFLLIRYLRDCRFSPFERQLCLESLGVFAIITVHSFFNVELTWHSPMFFLVVVGYVELLRSRKALALAPVRPSMAANWTKAQATS